MPRARYLAALRPLVNGEGVDDETTGYARKGIVDRFWDVGEYVEAGKAFRELIASAPPRFRLLGMGWGDYFNFILPRPDSHITIRGQLLDIYGLRYRKVK